MKHYFIINPVAGKGIAVDFLNEKLRQLFVSTHEEYEIYVTKGIRDATLFVRDKCKTEWDELRFYACGGDGTLCEVANGAAGAPHASVTSIPCGSGNDFVRNFAGDFRELASLLRAKEKPIDLMRFPNNTYGVNMCYAGFDANVALNMDKFKSLPLVNGPIAYQLSLVYCLLKKMFYHFRVVVDKEEVIEVKEKQAIYEENVNILSNIT